VHQHANEVHQAVNDLLSSEEFKHLESEQQIALRDTADVLRAEISNPNPDLSKAQRWARRLWTLAKEFGMHTAGAAFAKIVLNALGMPAV
jgi:hypothetical protein